MSKDKSKKNLSSKKSKKKVLDGYELPPLVELKPDVAIASIKRKYGENVELDGWFLEADYTMIFPEKGEDKAFYVMKLNRLVDRLPFDRTPYKEFDSKE